MRVILLGLLASVALSGAAHADAVYEAGSATGACLAAVIDGAPVVDMAEGGVAVHREKQPNLCAVTVTGGVPSEIRKAVLDAVAQRAEGFTPARTTWAPGQLASRETLCNAPGRRALNVVIETSKPGAPIALKATVIEGRARDQRCDIDMGLQQP